MPRDLPIGSDWELEWTLTRKNVESGELEPATGLAVSGFLSATGNAAAAPIDPALEVPLPERGGKPGTYAAAIDAADLAELLVGHVGRVIYECVKVAGDLLMCVPVVPRNR